MTADGLVFRPFREGDEDAVLRVLNLETEGGYSLDEWAWSFPPESDGRAIVVGEIGGEVAAVCAGAPTRVVVDGRECAAVEIRRLAARNRDDACGVLKHFVETCGSDGRFDLAIMARDLDRKALAGFEVVERDRTVVLERTASTSGSFRRLLYRAEPARDWEPRLDRLWQRVQGSYPVANVRDAESALRRFAGHPRIRHHRFLVCPRFSGHAVAAAVFVADTTKCRWFDLIWDHDHPGAVDLLSHISGRLARQFAADVEELRLVGDEAVADVLSRRHFQKSTAPSFVAVRSFDPKLDAGDLVDRIYLTSADIGLGDR